MSILKVENLNKKVGNKQLLDDVSFEINEGDILAFIGPNGAGKTTTIKCILGLSKISKGDITINGFDIKKDYIKAISKVGCLVESPDVYMYLTGYENLRMQASLYDNDDEEHLAKIIDLVGLTKRIDDKVSKYSLGMRQRLGLAIALINNPNLLILDEPTNGLDPEGIKELRELLLELAKNKIGILISSHNLSELESFCNKVCILQKGKILEEATIEEIKEANNNKYLITVNNIKKAKKLLKKTINIVSDNAFEIIKEEEKLNALLKKLIEEDIKIYEVTKVKMSLEEAFLNSAGGAKIE